jgi:hypothetical protein
MPALLRIAPHGDSLVAKNCRANANKIVFTAKESRKDDEKPCGPSEFGGRTDDENTCDTREFGGSAVASPTRSRARRRPRVGRNGPEPSLGSGFFRFGAFGGAGGLVVAGGVKDQIAEQFAGGGFDDSDVEVVDEDQDAGSGVGSGVGSADADVVQAAGHAQRDGAGRIDAVGWTRSWVSVRVPGFALGRAW